MIACGIARRASPITRGTVAPTTAPTLDMPFAPTRSAPHSPTSPATCRQTGVAVREDGILEVAAAGVRRAHEAEDACPVAPAGGEKGVDRVRAEVGVDRERVGERGLGTARLEEGGCVGTGGRADVASLGVRDHEQPGLGRVARDRLEREPTVAAERLEERHLWLHRDDVRRHGVDDPLAEPLHRPGGRRAAEHRLTAQLDRQQVDPWVEPDDELAAFPLDRLRDPIGERGHLDRLDVGSGAHAAKATPFTAARIASRSSGATRSSGAGRRRKPAIRSSSSAAVASSREQPRPHLGQTGLDLEVPPSPTRDRPAGDDGSGDEDRPHHPRLERGHDEAGAQRPQASDLVDPLDDLLERGDPVAQPGSVLEAQIARQATKPSVEPRQTSPGSSPSKPSSACAARRARVRPPIGPCAVGSVPQTQRSPRRRRYT